MQFLKLYSSMLFSTIPDRGRYCIAAFIVGLSVIGCSVPKPTTNPEAIEKYRKFVITDGGQIQISFLENSNPEGQLYVMVHGTPGSGSGWADYIAKPPANSEVIAIDRLGFGKSTTSKSFPSLQDQVAAIHQIIPPNKKNIILVGHSLGGPIVALYAAQYPAQVQSVVILAGSLDPTLEKIHPMQYVGDWGIIRPLLPPMIRNANEELMALKPQLEELSQMLSQIKAKVVIVHGDQDDLVPVENVQFLESHLTSASCIETIVIPGQNHFLPWDAQTTVRQAMQMASDRACTTLKK
jgi:pimeloyl-ACP methyl ester carboxylesterase